MPPNCYLTKLSTDDESDLIRLFTDVRIRAFLGGTVSKTEARKRVKTILTDDAAHPKWAARRAGDGAFLGIMSLDEHYDDADIEVSYVFLPEHHGVGYATAALQQVLTDAFQNLGLEKIVAETQSANVKSIRLLERGGMSFQRHVLRFGSQQCIYAIHRSEYLARPTPVSAVARAA